jgi:hypothetical protein
VPLYHITEEIQIKIKRFDRFLTDKTSKTDKIIEKETICEAQRLFETLLSV